MILDPRALRIAREEFDAILSNLGLGLPTSVRGILGIVIQTYLEAAAETPKLGPVITNGETIKVTTTMNQETGEIIAQTVEKVPTPKDVEVASHAHPGPAVDPMVALAESSFSDRLKELHAAATPGPWGFTEWMYQECRGTTTLPTEADHRLMEYLVNNREAILALVRVAERGATTRSDPSGLFHVRKYHQPSPDPSLKRCRCLPGELGAALEELNA